MFSWQNRLPMQRGGVFVGKLELSRDWLESASKHEIENVISQASSELKARFPKVREPKYGKLVRALNEQQLKTFFGNIPPHWVRRRFFYFTCLVFALRASEALKLRLSDVDLETGTLAVQSAKKGPNRIDYLPIPISWLPDFDWMREQYGQKMLKNDGYIFYSDRLKQKYWSTAYVRRSFHTVCEFPQCRAVGLAKTYCSSKDGRKLYLHSLHSLRHSAAKLFLKKNGNDLRLTRDFLRHSTVKSTEVYTQVSMEDLSKAANGTWHDSSLSFFK